MMCVPRDKWMLCPFKQAFLPEMIQQANLSDEQYLHGFLLCDGDFLLFGFVRPNFQSGKVALKAGVHGAVVGSKVGLYLCIVWWQSCRQCTTYRMD